jgi:hypothetical protein
MSLKQSDRPSGVLPQHADWKGVLAYLAEHGVVVCDTTARKWVRQGILPPPLSLPGRKHVWNLDLVAEAILRAGEGGAR